MKSTVAFFIQLSIVAAVVIGVLLILRIGDERASETAPAAEAASTEGEQIPPAEFPVTPAEETEPLAPEPKEESVAKEEHAGPDLS